jgi:hypothetical protein
MLTEHPERLPEVQSFVQQAHGVVVLSVRAHDNAQVPVLGRGLQHNTLATSPQPGDAGDPRGCHARTDLGDVNVDIHPWPTTTVVDQAAIDHERIFGCIVLAENDNILIRAAQRVDFDLLAEPVTARVSNPRLTLGSYYELTGPQARRAGGFLIEAADFVETIATRDRHVSMVRAVFGS